MPTTDPPAAIVAVVHTKGGVGKTTAAVELAHAGHERGLRVLAVDADPQQSLWGWHDAAPFPFRVACLPSKRLHVDVPGNVGRAQLVVIDTPGTEHGTPISRSAILAATHVLVPVAPTGAELREMRRVRALLDDADDVRHGPPPRVGVLLVKVRGGAASGPAFRAQLVADGWPVLRGEARLLERFAQAFGGPVEGAARTAYGDALAELLDLDRVPHHARQEGTA
jgi:chromosome partitioning protein